MDRVQARRIANELLSKQVSEWEILDICNEGKSAVVLKGSKGDEIAAIKVFDPELIERFGAERHSARIQRELSLKQKSHPNLVKILDGGYCEETGYWFIAMEYIDAKNLAEVLDILPRDSIRKIIAQVASAAKFLEDLQLAHRDIKPDNIAISPDFERATLLDLGVIRPFGLSELTDEDQKTFVGTLQYSSPEFLLRDEIDTMEGWRAVTYYQLGAVLHDMIMKRRIFSDFANPYGKLVRAIEREIPQIEATDVPSELILLARNCLLKSPDLRLRFVNWKDFELEAESRSAAEIAKDHIRKRQGILQRPQNSSDASRQQKDERIRRRTIEDIRTKLEDLVRREFVHSELFSPIEIHEFLEEKSKMSGFLVFIKASEQLSLSYSVTLAFNVELLDAASKAISLSVAIAISDIRLELETILTAPFLSIFEGAFEESVIAKLIETFVYPALDAAQQVDRNTAGLSGICQWLPVVKSKENE